MLWQTLWNKLGKQPMRITRHKHVHAIVDGRHYDMDLKFDAKGEPYLVPMQPKPKPEPVVRVLDYILSDEVPGILGSWTTTVPAAQYDLKQAIALLRQKHGNTLYRRVTVDGRLKLDYYDFIFGRWLRDGEPVPN